jgi:hypothetical protein
MCSPSLREARIRPVIMSEATMASSGVSGSFAMITSPSQFEDSNQSTLGDYLASDFNMLRDSIQVAICATEIGKGGLSLAPVTFRGWPLLPPLLGGDRFSGSAALPLRLSPAGCPLGKLSTTGSPQTEPAAISGNEKRAARGGS